MGANQVYLWPTTSLLNSSLVVSCDYIIQSLSVLSIHCFFCDANIGDSVSKFVMMNRYEVYKESFPVALMQTSIWSVQKGLSCVCCWTSQGCALVICVKIGIKCADRSKLQNFHLCVPGLYFLWKRNWMSPYFFLNFPFSYKNNFYILPPSWLSNPALARNLK